ncbi:hypothetical protein T265_07553 [Opisthorchis viverrini]|uniref:Uncharacterized protein n=1 Tax=Opisthorchis viverrini TaxID=6198 RepID=A0A075AB78_OPIVI|nr:hypothetical protein T265_07553 [Opisthorchis viverrini]KER24879.1 hypothetical protein T265_07553 [Opisthorchis viverrini]
MIVAVPYLKNPLMTVSNDQMGHAELRVKPQKPNRLSGDPNCEEKKESARGRELVLAYHNHSEALYLQTFTQAVWTETDNKKATDIGWQPYLIVFPNRRSRDHASRVGQLFAYATLDWAWKTVLSSANDGSAYSTHVPTNAASGAGRILQWK